MLSRSTFLFFDRRSAHSLCVGCTQRMETEGEPSEQYVLMISRQLPALSRQDAARLISAVETSGTFAGRSSKQKAIREQAPGFSARAEQLMSPL